MTAARKIRDDAVRRRIYLESYSTAETKKALKLLREAEKDIIAKIAVAMEDGNRLAIKRQNELLSSVRATMTDSLNRLGVEVEKGFTALASDQAKHTNASLASAAESAGLGVATQKIGASTAYAVAQARPLQGKFLADWLKDLPRDHKARITQALRISFVEGESMSNAIKRVRDMMNINRRGAEMLVRTAHTHIAAAVDREHDRLNEDIVEKFRWLSVLDRRTSPICRGRSGKIYPVKSGPRPPAHPRCRSTTERILKGVEPLKVETYDEWLRRQPESVQDEILGRKRAAVFRSGVKVDQFVEKTGKPVSKKALGIDDTPPKIERPPLKTGAFNSILDDADKLPVDERLAAVTSGVTKRVELLVKNRGIPGAGLRIDDFIGDAEALAEMGLVRDAISKTLRSRLKYKLNHQYMVDELAAGRVPEYRPRSAFENAWAKSWQTLDDRERKALALIDDLAPDGNPKAGAYYKAGQHNINMSSKHLPDKPHDAGVWRHEVGHAIDYDGGHKALGKVGFRGSNSFSNREFFRDLIEEDRKAYLRNRQVIKPAKLSEIYREFGIDEADSINGLVKLPRAKLIDFATRMVRHDRDISGPSIARVLEELDDTEIISFSLNWARGDINATIRTLLPSFDRFFGGISGRSGLQGLAGMTDILGGMTRNKFGGYVQGFYGHRTGYWTETGNYLQRIGTETFANVFEALTADPRERELMLSIFRIYTPNALKAVERSLDELQSL